MARSPLTEKFLRIVALRDEVKTWPQDEQDFFLDMLAPEPVKSQGRATKRTGKKSASKGTSKSSRAQSLSGVIQRTPKVKTDDDVDPNAHCQKEFAGGFICDEPADANVHHLRGATGYHEFDVGKSPAPRAGAKSSTNGGSPAQARDTRNLAPSSRSESDDRVSRNASSSSPNPEDETVSAGAVAGGLNE